MSQLCKGVSILYKIPQPCDNLVTTLQGCSKVPQNFHMGYIFNFYGTYTCGVEHEPLLIFNIQTFSNFHFRLNMIHIRITQNFNYMWWYM